MDVREVYDNLVHDPDTQRSLEELLLRSVQVSLDDMRETLDSAEERLEELRQELAEETNEDPDGADTPDDIKAQIAADIAAEEEEWRWWRHQRDDLVQLVAAIAGAGGGSDPDCLIDHAAIEEIIQRRRARSADTEAKPALRLVGLTRRRRGRPPVWNWPNFTAEMTRRCMEGPIANQTELERHMAQWCADSWGAEPALSQIREWVSPTVKAIQAAATPTDSADN
jgi:hypothetical protein